MVDVLIITALQDELTALKSIEDGGIGGWAAEKDSLGFTYYRRNFSGTHGTLQVAAVAATGLGGDPTIEAALRTIPHLQPACLAMCGICAGRRGDCYLGDVIVADKVFRYDVGKVKDKLKTNAGEATQFFADVTTYQIKDQWIQDIHDMAKGWRPTIDRPLSLAVQGNWLLDQLANGKRPQDHPEVATRVTDWKVTLGYLRGKKMIGKTGEILQKGRKHIQEILFENRDQLPDAPPFKVHLAPIASGSKVVEDKTLFERRIIKLVRKTLGLEMEAAAIGRVAAMAGIPSMLIAKGVSDHADEDKDDSFRHFAARASAEFLLQFLRHTLVPEQVNQTGRRTKKAAPSELRSKDPDEGPNPDEERPSKSPHPDLKKKVAEILSEHFAKSYWQPVLPKIWRGFGGSEESYSAGRLTEMLMLRAFSDVPSGFTKVLRPYCLNILRQHSGADTQAKDLFDDSEDLFGWLVLLEVAVIKKDHVKLKDRFLQTPLIAATLAGLEIRFKWSHEEKAEFVEDADEFAVGKAGVLYPSKHIETGLEIQDHLVQLADYLFKKVDIPLPAGADMAEKLQRVNNRIKAEADAGNRMYIIVNKADLSDPLNDSEMAQSMRAHIPDLPVLYYQKPVDGLRGSITLTCDEGMICASMGAFFKARRDCLSTLSQRKPNA